MAKVLLLSSNPLDSDTLRGGEELRDIREAILRVPERRLSIEMRLAVRAQDLQAALLEVNPSVVHFTGHGNENGELVLENPLGFPEPVSLEALTALFGLFKSTVRCVVLNACNSSGQARILPTDCAIGMDGEISDGAGKAFSVAFYTALAHGKDVNTAFEIGRNAIQLNNSDSEGEENLPQLYMREGLATFSVQSDEISLDSPLFVSSAFTAAAVEVGETEQLALSPSSYDTDPPLIVEKCAKRESTLRRIRDELNGRNWYAVHGGIGTGKTNLAVLMAAPRKGLCCWIRFRDRSPREAIVIAESILSHFRQRRLGQTKTEWLKDSIASLGSDSVIVLDDLPKTNGREDFDNFLISIARAIQQCDSFLITTAAVPIPTSVKAAAAERLLEESIPPFSEDEIRELLAANGAPEQFLATGWVSTVSTLSRQHPLILTEAVRFLASREWKTDAATFQEILSGQYAINLDAPTQSDLQRTVPDNDSRELLYRLRLVNNAFTDEIVRDLASVPKTVEHPGERLANLLGLWIQSDGRNRYVVSPLISRLPDSNLDVATAKRVHELLGSRLVERTPLTPFIVVEAITHLTLGGLYERAGMLLFSALQSYRQTKGPKEAGLLLSIWADIPLPAQMPLHLRLSIRATQIGIFQQTNKDCTYLLDDLERLTDSGKLPTQFEMLRILVAGTLGSALWSSRPVDAARYAVDALQYLRKAPKAIGPVRRPRIQKGFFYILWSTFCKIANDEDLVKWLTQLESLNSHELALFARAKLADKASEIGCDEVWLREYRKPADDRDWIRILDVLSYIREWSRKYELTILFAREEYSRIVVLAEYLDQFDFAIEIGKDAIDKCGGHENGVFWLNEIIGKQYYYKRRWKDALAWLMRCVESPASIESSKRSSITCLAGIIAARLGDDRYLPLLERAADIVDSDSRSVSANVAGAVYGELGIEMWVRRERAATFFRVWSRAADRLLSVTGGNNDWKVKITLFGNSTGYFAHVTEHGNDTNWPFAKPEPGALIETNESVLEQFDPQKLVVIGAQMTLLAENLELYDESLAWAKRTTLADFWPEMGAAIVPYRVAADVNDGKFVQATDGAWKAYIDGAAILAQGKERQGKFSQHMSRVSVVVIAVALARLRLTPDVSSADRACAEIKNHIQTLYYGPLDYFWASALDALEQIVRQERQWTELYSTAQYCGERGETTLDIMYRVAAIMAAAPREAFNLVVYSLQKSLIPLIPNTCYNTVVIPFIREYWNWSAEHCGIHFSLPAQTREDLRVAFKSPGELGLRIGLKVVASRLGISVSDSLKSYLEPTD